MIHMNPEKALEVEAFKALHPEVDWNLNEVLYGFDESEAHLSVVHLVPKSWWTKADRDGAFQAMYDSGRFRMFQDVDGDWHVNCIDCGAVPK